MNNDPQLKQQNAGENKVRQAKRSRCEYEKGAIANSENTCTCKFTHLPPEFSQYNNDNVALTPSNIRKGLNKTRQLFRNQNNQAPFCFSEAIARCEYKNEGFDVSFVSELDKPATKIQGNEFYLTIEQFSVLYMILKLSKRRSTRCE